MQTVLDDFAAALGVGDKDIVARVKDYAAWAVGRREAAFAPSYHDDVQLRTYLLHRKLAGDGREELNATTDALQRFYE